jgi:hypothetical protein
LPTSTFGLATGPFAFVAIVAEAGIASVTSVGFEFTRTYFCGSALNFATQPAQQK